MKTIILLLLIPILISGQTVTEKIKAKWAEQKKAKQERLEECEDINDERDTAWVEKGISWADYFVIGRRALPVSASWLKQFVGYWDEYAKECYADSASTHTYSPKWYDRCYEPIGNMEDGYIFVLRCNDPDHYYYTHKQPDFFGFIEFLRNKLGEK